MSVGADAQWHAPPDFPHTCSTMRSPQHETRSTVAQHDVMAHSAIEAVCAEVPQRVRGCQARARMSRNRTSITRVYRTSRLPFEPIGDGFYSLELEAFPATCMGDRLSPRLRGSPSPAPTAERDDPRACRTTGARGVQDLWIRHARRIRRNLGLLADTLHRRFKLGGMPQCRGTQCVTIVSSFASVPFGSISIVAWCMPNRSSRIEFR